MSEQDGPWAFYKKQNNGTWLCVIVAKTERSKPNGEVIDIGVFYTQDNAQDWAKTYMGPDAQIVYTDPAILS